MKIGEKWYVKLPHQIELEELEIAYLTGNTIALRKEGCTTSYRRYCKADVELVERADDWKE